MSIIHGYSKLPIFHKLLILLLSSLLIFAATSQIIITGLINHSLTEELNKRLKQNTEEIHDIIDLTLTESLKNYLRGIIDDTMFSLQAIEQARLEGRISNEVALRNIEAGLSSRQIGSQGYFYVLNSQGNIVFHPVKELIGQNVSEYDFVRDQMQEREGYIEYMWRNPGEPKPREKALYMTYLDSRDWILTLSVYKEDFADLVDIDSIDSILNSYEPDYRGYSFIFDTEGTMISHPFMKDRNIDELERADFLQEVLQKAREGNYEPGIIEYQWQNPDDARPEDKRLYYSYIPRYHWFVATSYYLKGMHDNVELLRNIFLLVDAIFSAIFIPVLIAFSRSLTRPMTKLSQHILQEDLMRRAGVDLGDTKDEIRIAQRAFETYIDLLQTEKNLVVAIGKQNEALAAFPSQLQLPVFRVNLEGEVLFANQAARDLMLQFQSDTSALLDKRFLADADELSASKTIFGQDYRIIKTPLPGHDEMYLHFYDLTLENRFETLQNLWTSVFDTSVEGIAVTDNQARIERVNASFTHITGYEPEEILGKAFNILRSGHHDDDFYRGMWESLNNTGTWQGTIWNRRKSSEVYPQWLSLSTFRDGRSGNLKYLAVFHDVSEIYEKEMQLEFLNSHDALTGLPNRNLFFDRLSQVLSSAQRNNDIFAIILMDVDGFSTVNDGLGKLLGDQYLVNVGQRLRESIREQDTLARLGSDEFALLLPRLEQKNRCGDLLRRIAAAVSQPLQLGDVNIRPSLTMGVSFFPDDGSTVDQLMHGANVALSRAKETSRGSYRVFDQHLDEEMLKRFEMENSLKRAIEAQEFYLVYQPKILLQDASVMGAEALLRWEHPSMGFVSPQVFIPVLEDSGAIVSVGQWIIEQACTFLNKLSDLGRDELSISVNISVKQFTQPDFVDELVHTVQRYNLAPHRLELEITERLAAIDMDIVVENLRRLAQLDFPISIDDFGTGYSSLRYIKDLAFDYLKIDRSFISPLPEDSQSLSIVRTVISLAKNLGKGIVAEGVETEEQERICRQEGCDIVQGYYFSKPLSEQAFFEFISPPD